MARFTDISNSEGVTVARTDNTYSSRSDAETLLTLVVRLAVSVERARRCSERSVTLRDDIRSTMEKDVSRLELLGRDDVRYSSPIERLPLPRPLPLP